MTSTFKGAELKYSKIDKQAYTVYKSAKHFRPYLLKSRTKVIMPYESIRNVLIQKELGEKRAHWMTMLQEYGMEIKPSNIVKGQGLCLLAAQSNDPEKEQLQWNQEEGRSEGFVNVIFAPTSEWYDDIQFFLTHGFSPQTLDFKKRRALRLKVAPYQFIDGVHFRRNYDGVFLRCLEKAEVDNILLELHAGPTGGHCSGDTAVHKILIRVGYYWSALLKNAYAFVRKCESCQRCAGKENKSSFPFQPFTMQFPFQQWDLDFVGPITPPYSLQH